MCGHDFIDANVALSFAVAGLVMLHVYCCGSARYIVGHTAERGARTAEGDTGRDAYRGLGGGKWK